eukprot:9469309-Pyramimonas_sp.AAC.1
MPAATAALLRGLRRLRQQGIDGSEHAGVRGHQVQLNSLGADRVRFGLKRRQHPAQVACKVAEREASRTEHRLHDGHGSSEAASADDGLLLEPPSVRRSTRLLLLVAPRNCERVLQQRNARLVVELPHEEPQGSGKGQGHTSASSSVSRLKTSPVPRSWTARVRILLSVVGPHPHFPSLLLYSSSSSCSVSSLLLPGPRSLPPSIPPVPTSGPTWLLPPTRSCRHASCRILIHPTSYLVLPGSLPPTNL